MHPQHYKYGTGTSYFTVFSYGELESKRDHDHGVLGKACLKSGGVYMVYFKQGILYEYKVSNHIHYEIICWIGIINNYSPQFLLTDLVLNSMNFTGYFLLNISQTPHEVGQRFPGTFF